jgi:uncharacterized GH25 family protein
MNSLRVSVASSLIVALASCAFAHDTWLIPDRFVVERDSVVNLDLTSGMAFPALDTSIKPERIDRALCRLAGHSFELKEYSAASKSLLFKARLSESGIATMWVELKPKSLVLTTKLVNEYLDEIGASELIRQQWAKAKRPRRWREVYTKHSKTFVRVGEPQSDRSWAEPVGMRLEIVPEKDPTALRVGEELAVRVLKNGAPLPGFSVGIVSTNDAKGNIRKTDAEGRATFRLDRGGRWLVRVTELRKSTQAGIDWESDSTTLTFQVGSE